MNPDPSVKIPEKLFFKIGEVSRITGVKSHVLRYWETEFPALNPPKNRAAQRAYRKKDIETILQIKTLLYEENYTISGARKRLREMRSEEKSRGQMELFGRGVDRKQVQAAIGELEKALKILEG
ncbi:MAG: MerR family transcriptional regulator [Proteobacteria bacterium]|mgnify:CR=1 FL=1|nr:MerR family transcriptional regulator [Pseudomonadota bacterium]